MSVDAETTLVPLRKLFNERFELRFSRPQVDTYTTCEDLMVKIKSKTLNENAKKTYSAEYMIHKRRANKFYNKMKEITKKCKEDDVVDL
ncbi:unnamed protein product [Pieris brassicae]|uniref:Uncharacterized protein n=1 Tax=Pieris brassicae TaxID=7116 RepID=A0A9P0TIV3_PIEBR|nr:unnamed protein product [Pieris brassicae]